MGNDGSEILERCLALCVTHVQSEATANGIDHNSYLMSGATFEDRNEGQGLI